jgi:hypothetical protein
MNVAVAPLCDRFCFAGLVGLGSPTTRILR